MAATRKTKLPSSYPKSLQHVTIVLNENKASELVFEGFVRQIQSDGRVEIELPDDVNPDHLTSGLEVLLQYNRNDVYYHFKSRIIEISEIKFAQKKSGIAHRILIAAQKNPDKIQRRDYFRISERMTVSLKKVILPKHFLEDLEIRRRAIIEFKKLAVDADLQIESLDLSGGGLGGLCNSPLKLNHHYLATFSLENKEFSVAAKVRHNDELSFGRYRIGLEFIGLSDHDREHIIQFVFKAQTQRLSRKKST